jgi:glutaconate CoA-transferase subunit B
MMTRATEYRLCELMICAAAESFAGNGEVLATGIGVIPRLAASLAMKTCNTDLMMTDSEAWMLSEPNPVSGRNLNEGQKQESWMGFSRIFDNVWGGKRYALVGPSQIDQFGQTNLVLPIDRLALTKQRHSNCNKQPFELTHYFLESSIYEPKAHH